MNRLFQIASVLFLMLFVGMGLMFVDVGTISAETKCVIPDSGPWPPCATGGAPAAIPDTGSECAIPDSGPWPPCATNGSGSTTTDECVIPASGPWPSCATSGSPSPSTPTGACAIPDSGPWPPCASGGAVPAPLPADGATSEPVSKKTRIYSVGEVRNLFVQVFNNDKENNPDASSIVAFQKDSAIKIENGVIIISSHFDGFATGYALSSEAAMTISVLNGDVNMEFVWLELFSERIEDGSERWTDFESGSNHRFREKLQADLSYSVIESIDVDEMGMTVIYR